MTVEGQFSPYDSHMLIKSQNIFDKTDNGFSICTLNWRKMAYLRKSSVNYQNFNNI